MVEAMFEFDNSKRRHGACYSRQQVRSKFLREQPTSVQGCGKVRELEIVHLWAQNAPEVGCARRQKPEQNFFLPCF